MADTLVTSLQMTFLNASGAPYTFSVRYPKSDLTTLQIETFMNLVIAKDIFLSSGGALLTKKDGGIVSRSFTDLVD
jgi:hypothetical protein